MIKEFWQEHRENKKQLKKQRRHSKKHPQTGEQKAYRIFGFIFVIGLMIGCVAFCCRQSGDVPSYSWDSVIGITDEMKEALTQNVKESDLYSDPIDIVDWSDARDKLITGGLSAIIKNDSFDFEELEKNHKITSDIELKENEIGAIINRLFSTDEYVNYLTIKYIDIYWEDDQAYMKTVIVMDLSLLIAGTELPMAYVTTTSCLDILNENLACIGANVQLNQIESALNEEIVQLINKSSVVEISYFTNNYVAMILNGFKSSINADFIIQNNGICLKVK